MNPYYDPCGHRESEYSSFRRAVALAGREYEDLHGRPSPFSDTAQEPVVPTDEEPPIDPHHD